MLSAHSLRGSKFLECSGLVGVDLTPLSAKQTRRIDAAQGEGEGGMRYIYYTSNQDGADDSSSSDTSDSVVSRGTG